MGIQAAKTLNKILTQTLFEYCVPAGYREFLNEIKEKLEVLLEAAGKMDCLREKSVKQEQSILSSGNWLIRTDSG